MTLRLLSALLSACLAPAFPARAAVELPRGAGSQGQTPVVAVTPADIPPLQIPSLVEPARDAPPLLPDQAGVSPGETLAHAVEQNAAVREAADPQTAAASGGLQFGEGKAVRPRTVSVPGSSPTTDPGLRLPLKGALQALLAQGWALAGEAEIFTPEGLAALEALVDAGRAVPQAEFGSARHQWQKGIGWLEHGGQGPDLSAPRDLRNDLQALTDRMNQANPGKDLRIAEVHLQRADPGSIRLNFVHVDAYYYTMTYALSEEEAQGSILYLPEPDGGVRTVRAPARTGVFIGNEEYAQDTGGAGLAHNTPKGREERYLLVVRWTAGIPVGPEALKRISDWTALVRHRLAAPLPIDPGGPRAKEKIARIRGLLLDMVRNNQRWRNVLRRYLRVALPSKDPGKLLAELERAITSLPMRFAHPAEIGNAVARYDAPDNPISIVAREILINSLPSISGAPAEDLLGNVMHEFAHHLGLGEPGAHRLEAYLDRILHPKASPAFSEPAQTTAAARKAVATGRLFQHLQRYGDKLVSGGDPDTLLFLAKHSQRRLRRIRGAVVKMRAEMDAGRWAQVADKAQWMGDRLRISEAASDADADMAVYGELLQRALRAGRGRDIVPFLLATIDADLAWNQRTIDSQRKKLGIRKISGTRASLRPADIPSEGISHIEYGAGNYRGDPRGLKLLTDTLDDLVKKNGSRPEGTFYVNDIDEGAAKKAAKYLAWYAERTYGAANRLDIRVLAGDMHELGSSAPLTRTAHLKNPPDFLLTENPELMAQTLAGLAERADGGLSLVTGFPDKFQGVRRLFDRDVRMTPLGAAQNYALQDGAEISLPTREYLIAAPRATLAFSQNRTAAGESIVLSWRDRLYYRFNDFMSRWIGASKPSQAPGLRARLAAVDEQLQKALALPRANWSLVREWIQQRARIIEALRIEELRAEIEKRPEQSLLRDLERRELELRGQELIDEIARCESERAAYDEGYWVVKMADLRGQLENVRRKLEPHSLH